MRGSSEELGSGPQVELGDYHVYVDKCEEHVITIDKDKPTARQVEKWSLEITILTGTVPGQESKRIIYDNDYFSRDVLKLAAACGLVNKVTGQVFTDADRKAMEEAAKRKEHVEFEFSPADLEGCSFYCDVVMGKPRTTGKSAGKSFPKLGNNIRSLLDPSVAGLPKDPEIWAAVSGGKPANGTANGKPVAAGSLLD